VDVVKDLDVLSYCFENSTNPTPETLAKVAADRSPSLNKVIG